MPYLLLIYSKNIFITKKRELLVEAAFEAVFTVVDKLLKGRTAVRCPE